ncbi:MAG: tyrosine-type recombinase/integrase [Chitinophagales bacterium]|nr:tyrosine-type recombinase/integrase [Chitinophagales bacterium]MDW8419750.1 tyrosine-type recombinase/integrase [Chitinophagales bacterium]
MEHPFSSFLQYLEYEKRYSPHTLTAYQNDLLQFEAFFRQHGTTSDIKQATHVDIRNWIVSLMTDKLSARSINRKISALKSYYKFLMRKGEITRHPFAKVQTPKIPSRLPQFVEQRGMELLLEEVTFSEGYSGILEKIIIELLYATGMRRSELVRLRQDDVDFHRAQIKVLGKGNKERLIPLHTGMVQRLREYLREKQQYIQSPAAETLLCDEKGKALTPHKVYQIVKKYLSLVNTLEKRSPHILRHTFATHLMNNGADINAVKELLGHSSLAATQVYTHNTIDKLKEIYKKAHPKA